MTPAAPQKTTKDRIDDACRAERRRCLNIIEEINAAGQHLSASSVLAMAHSQIAKGSQA